jgi:hypothetical protein
MNVTFWPYDVGSDKKVTTGKRMCAAGLDLDFDLHSQLDGAATKPNARLHRTSVDWTNYLKNDSPEASLEASLC